MKKESISLKLKSISNRGAKGTVPRQVLYVVREGPFKDSEKKKRDPLLYASSGNMPTWAWHEGDEDAGSLSKVSYKFWTLLDECERKNGQLCKSIVIGLPVDFSLEQKIELAEKYAAEVTIVAGVGGLPWCLALHSGGRANPHIHLLISTRINDGVERPPKLWFSRAANCNYPPESGGAKKLASWSSRKLVYFLREKWEVMCNEALELHSAKLRVTRESNMALDIDKIPTIRVGKGRDAGKRRNYNAIVRLFNFSNGSVRRWIVAGFIRPGGLENLGEPEFNALMGFAEEEGEKPKAVHADSIASLAMFEQEMMRCGHGLISQKHAKKVSEAFWKRREQDLQLISGTAAREHLAKQVKFFGKKRAGPRRSDFARLNLPRDGVSAEYLAYIVECVRDIEDRAWEASQQKLREAGREVHERLRCDAESLYEEQSAFDIRNEPLAECESDAGEVGGARQGSCRLSHAAFC